MKFHWETDDERLLRWMKITPKKKLEWLQEMHEWQLKTFPRRRKFLREYLRG